MSEVQVAAEILGRSRAILLDFDGPVCGVFSGITDMTVSDVLREEIRRLGFEVPAAVEPQNDPLEVLRFAATLGDPTVTAVDDRFRLAEIEAVALAAPTPYAIEFVRAAVAASKKIAIVSNNSAEAVEAYLERHQIRSAIGPIVGRAHARPDLMKPHPWSVLSALDRLGEPAEAAVLVGDSRTDMEVSVATGVWGIGFANKEGKSEVLRRAGAAAIASGPRGMALLVEAVSWIH
ncbi:HAD family hydrolase [Catellatospora aurea]|uniref:HAD family hydrolase n=1 Tax=Catellatospora aurea TaxID=1337874 RepID=A0ABW2GZC3_9ACTN